MPRSTPSPAPAWDPSPAHRRGPGARVVVVPGLGLDGRSWEPVTRASGVAVDVRPLPGYGHPVPPSVTPDPEALGRRLAEELPTGEPVVLAGHSCGAQVAAHAARAAALRPDGPAVAGLVLVGPTTDPRAASWPRLVARWLRTAAHEDPRQVPGLVAQYRRTGLRTMVRTMDRARRDDLRATLAGLDVPVLVLRGPADRICPADWAASLGEVVTLPAGGHMVPSTHGPAVAAAVARFLAGLAGLAGCAPG